MKTITLAWYSKKKQEKYFTLHLHMNEILSYTHLQVFHVSRLLECTNNNILFCYNIQIKIKTNIVSECLLFQKMVLKVNIFYYMHVHAKKKNQNIFYVHSLVFIRVPTQI